MKIVIRTLFKSLSNGISMQINNQTYSIEPSKRRNLYREADNRYPVRLGIILSRLSAGYGYSIWRHNISRY